MFYGAKRPDGNGTVIQVDREQCPGSLTFKLTPFGVIAGTVRDSDGEPLINAGVTIARRTFEHGKPSMEIFDGAMTDDLGQYRLGGVPPGRYYVSAQTRGTGWDGWNKVDHSPTSTQPEYASVPTFFPGVQDRAVATPIVVVAGARVSGIDITLLRTRVFNVTGRVIQPGGAAADRVSLELKDYLHTATKNADGDFELRGVAPGSYLLLANGRSLTGTVPIEVSAADVSGVRVQLGAMAQVKGRIILEGDKKPDLSSRRVWFTSSANNARSDEIANNAFSASLPPGHYSVDSLGYWPRGFYAKSIHSGDLDLLNDGLTIDQPGSVAVEITLASDGGNLDGAVLDKDQRPQPAATVVLIPSRRNRVDLFETTTTDQYGHYEFNPVPPGDYKLFAWGDPEPGSWFDPEFLKDFEKSGEPVMVQPNGRISTQLNLLPVAR
jgi:hypothetical protein